jgi:glucosamine-6-phosphate deaminase
VRRVVRATPAEVAAYVADRVAAQLTVRPSSVLGLATGATMVPVHEELARRGAALEIRFARAVTFNLDEFVGVAGDDPVSFRAEMRRLLFDRAGFKPERTHLPDGMAADPDAEAARYEAAIAAAGGIDLCLVGIGANGHVAFCEPGTRFDSRTHVARLAPETIESNRARLPPGRAVPERGITMGLATIMAAREIVLVATGAAKRAILARALEGPVDESCPASILQRHGRLVVAADRAAAG